MSLLGADERMTAERAREIGLVTEVVPRDELHGADRVGGQGHRRLAGPRRPGHDAGAVDRPRGVPPRRPSRWPTSSPASARTPRRSPKASAGSPPASAWSGAPADLPGSTATRTLSVSRRRARGGERRQFGGSVDRADGDGQSVIGSGTARPRPGDVVELPGPGAHRLVRLGVLRGEGRVLDVALVAPDLEVVLHRGEELLVDPLLRGRGVAWASRRPPAVATTPCRRGRSTPCSIGVHGERQPVLLDALEGGDRAAEADHPAVDPQHHVVRVVAADVGPAGEELPDRSVGVPVERDRRDRRVVHVAEVHAVGAVLGDDLGVHRLASALAVIGS